MAVDPQRSPRIFDELRQVTAERRRHRIIRISLMDRSGMREVMGNDYGFAVKLLAKRLLNPDPLRAGTAG